MKIRTFSYRFAEEILQHPRYLNAYNELVQVCKDCPLPLYKGKSKTQKEKDIVQQIMNTYFFLRLKSMGWETEPLATPEDYEDALRADFRKSFFDDDGVPVLTIQIEVEFGNVASSYRNYFKFQLSFANALTDICVLIVPSQHLSTRIDSGVANFEKACREIPSAKLSVTVPVLVIGLFDDDVATWDVKAIQPDLDIVKGSSNKTLEKHKNLVKSYIDTL